MQTPPRASDRLPRRPARLRRAIAWGGSVVVHAAAIAIVSRATWEVAEHEPPRPVSVVWLSEMPPLPISVAPPTLPESEAIDEPEPSVTPQDDDTPSTAPAEAERQASTPPPERREDAPQREAPEATRAAVDSPEAFDDARPDDVPSADAPRGTPDDSSADDSRDDAPATERRSRNYIVREVDIEEATRDAIAQVSEQLALAERYPTFSLDDVIEAPPPEEPGQPNGDIFEAPRVAGGGAFTPGRSGGPIGRKITALCDILGGVGLSLGGFGVGSICSEREPFTYFAHLKPTYMLARPVCTRNPGVEAPEIDGPGDPTVKCRLVVGDEPVPEDLAADETLAARPDAASSEAGGDRRADELGEDALAGGAAEDPGERPDVRADRAGGGLPDEDARTVRARTDER